MTVLIEMKVFYARRIYILARRIYILARRIFCKKHLFRKIQVSLVRLSTGNEAKTFGYDSAQPHQLNL